MNWLYNFKTYCQESGIHLLPDDMRYIETMLKKLCPVDRRQVAHKYYGVWVRSLSEAPYPAMAQNYARNRANTYLRDVCDRK